MSAMPPARIVPFASTRVSSCTGITTPFELRVASVSRVNPIQELLVEKERLRFQRRRAQVDHPFRWHPLVHEPDGEEFDAMTVRDVPTNQAKQSTNAFEIGVS